MAQAEIKIINDRELLALLDELVPKVRDKVIMAGMRKAAKIINDQAKKNFRATQKNKSITGYENFNSLFKVKAMRSKEGVIVGVQDSTKGYIYRFINENKGQKRSYRTASGKMHNTGVLRATHFFTDAVESKKQEAIDNVQNAVVEQMEKTVQKYNKKYML
jgi:hypothetical protein